jgi:cyclophilin family peptidyl-prolyl cis-trans isomerase
MRRGLRCGLDWTVLLALVSGLAFAGHAHGQDPTAAFEKAYKQFSSTVKEARDIQIEYRLAKESERGKLREAFYAKMDAAKRQMPELSKLAEAALKAHPESQPLRDFLWQMAIGARILRDDYEESLRLSELMIQGVKALIDEERKAALYLLAATSAFELGRLDAAEKYLKSAGQSPHADAKAVNKMRGDLEEERKYWAEEEALRKAETKPDGDPQALPRVLLKIGNPKGEPKGDVVVELFENEAPNTVANFISLVEKKFYDGKTFHRVVGGDSSGKLGFAAQGGCPKGDGTGDAGYKIPCECYGEKFRRHFRGSLSMAHAGQDTGGSQFFIALSTSGVRHLDRKLTADKKPDGGHTVFGRVIQGMDVVTQFQRRDPSKLLDQSIEPDKIISATVLRKRQHEYVPKKVEEAKKAEKGKDEKGKEEKVKDEKGKDEKSKEQDKTKEKPKAVDGAKKAEEAKAKP